MSKLDVIRAWKDEEYRLSLSDAQRSKLPEHPAGVIELADEELDAAGGTYTAGFITVFCHTAIIIGEDRCLMNVA